jgi:hypothetical protein
LSKNSPTWALHGDEGQVGKHAGDDLDWMPTTSVDWAGRSSVSMWSSRRCEWGQMAARARDRWRGTRGKGDDGRSVDRCLSMAVDGSGRLVALARSMWGCQLD